MAKIVAGSGGEVLAERLSRLLNIELLPVEIVQFADSGIEIQLKGSLFAHDIVIVQSICKPINDRLIELLLLIDTVKHAGARRVIAVIPYLGYSRGDRQGLSEGSVAARLVANMLENAKLNGVITLDLHSQRSKEFFKMAIKDLDPAVLWYQKMREFTDIRSSVMVSPDRGSSGRAQRLGALCGATVAVIDKYRQQDRTCHMRSITGDVVGKNCIIVDDIVDSGETLVKAAAFLRERGAVKVDAIVTHVVLSGAALERIEHAAIERIVTTTSISHQKLPGRFEALDIAPLFAAALQEELVQ